MHVSACCRTRKACQHQHVASSRTYRHLPVEQAWAQGPWQPCWQLKQAGEIGWSPQLQQSLGAHIPLPPVLVTRIHTVHESHRAVALVMQYACSADALLCDGRSAALERYSSISLLSPTGSLFMGPMKTPRLSAILSADMEPQAPQDAAGSAGAAGGMWSPVAGDMRLSHGAVNPAGGKQSISAARFDDRCTEVCEAAQGVLAHGGCCCSLQQPTWQPTGHGDDAVHATSTRRWVGICRHTSTWRPVR